MRRRTFIGAGMAMPFASSFLLSACSGGREMTAAPYIEGNYGPVSEEITAADLPVTGEIPRELVGRYLRNGPNPIHAVDASSYHWFIGDGMVHGVRLDSGRADWYRNRWVRSQGIIEALGESAGERELGGGPNTHVIGHAGTTWALVESGTPPVELTYGLETVGQNSFFGTLPDGFSAHPKLDPDTGDLHAVCYHWPDAWDHVQYVVVSAAGRVTRKVDIPVPGMVMIHDMSLTENYAVIYDLPVTVSPWLLAQGRSFPFAWNDDYAPRVGLLPRDGEANDIIWCEVGQCYVYHPMNAYEDTEGRVVVDVCRYERMFQQDTHGPFGDSLATLDRWTIDPKTRRVSEERVDERPQEFPRCHPALNSKPYRYGYTVSLADGGFTSIFKHDMKTGTNQQLDLGAGRHAGEPLFIPREGATAEDDGYLVTFVYDQGANKSELIILAANDLAEAPLARVHLPVRVPYGFHGSWVSDSEVSPASGPIARV